MCTPPPVLQVCNHDTYPNLMKFFVRRLCLLSLSHAVAGIGNIFACTWLWNQEDWPG